MSSLNNVGTSLQKSSERSFLHVFLTDPRSNRQYKKSKCNCTVDFSPHATRIHCFSSIHTLSTLGVWNTVCGYTKFFEWLTVQCTQPLRPVVGNLSILPWWPNSSTPHNYWTKAFVWQINSLQWTRIVLSVVTDRILQLRILSTGPHGFLCSESLMSLQQKVRLQHLQCVSLKLPSCLHY